MRRFWPAAPVALLLAVACGAGDTMQPGPELAWDHDEAAEAGPPVAPTPLVVPTSTAQDDLVGLTVAPAPSPERAAAFAAAEPKSVIELQQWRRSTTVQAAGARGPRWMATFVDLNPWVHEWFLVELLAPDGTAHTYHLENHDPDRVSVELDPAYADGLTLRIDGAVLRCALWAEGAEELERARSSGHTYAPVCEGWLSVRSPAEGRRSAKEATVEFLRDRVWGGEELANLVKETFYEDAQLATSAIVDGSQGVGAHQGAGFPKAAAVVPAAIGKRVVPENFGLPLLAADGVSMEVGRWYQVAGSPGVYASAMQPRLVDPHVTAGWGKRVRPLDNVESSALVYMTAFDLDQLWLDFDVGTDHPRVGWSTRAPASMRNEALAGPDGFDTLDPLVRTGMVNPVHVPRLVATFTGGFKRSHGAFRSGPLSRVNQATHYGWVEHGVVESRPMPGLATLVARTDGTVDLRVWQSEHDAGLWAVRHLRQNGPPIVLPDEAGRPVPGDLVNRWGDGNWSGSVEGKQRSVRATLCVQDSEAGRFLLYGYFSSATPSAMARVLAAYGCGVAMLTDMNALEHTYLSLHHFHDDTYGVHHLITGMDVLDRTTRGGVYLPRFVGLADNRDFFTVTRRR